MRYWCKLSVLLLLFTTGCHRAAVSTAVGVGPYGQVSTGVSVYGDADDNGLVALSIIGAMVGAAVYQDTHSYRYQGLSAIDVNIRPKDAAISLDGVVVGSADQYDGYPGFLVVNPGTHTVRARKAGYRPYEVTVRLQPGEQVNLNKHMEILPPGARAEAPAAVPVQSPPKPEAKPVPPRGTQPYRVVLTLANPEASVYVDGRFIGTGRELNALHAPLELDPDATVLTVVTDASRQRFSLRELKPDPDGVIRLSIDN